MRTAQAIMAALLTLAAAAGTVAASTTGEPVGHVRPAVVDESGVAHEEVRCYVPREGDLIFFDDQSVLWEKLYKLGGTKPPFHVGIVVKKKNGTLAVLESGPDDTLHVYILEVSRRLHTFKGILQIRRCKVDLTPEQSAALTDFAYEQEGKRYAMWRLLLQGTPIRTRGPVSSKLFGNTYKDRSRWLCAEIVCTAASLVGLFDGKVIKGTDTYPLDIVDDHLYELGAKFYEAERWTE